MRGREGVLLERAGVVVATDLAGGADGVDAGEAGRAVAAGRRHPFDADAVAGFEGRGVGPGAEGGDGADAFMAADLAGLGGIGEDPPLNEWE